jgi:hypothetical protein
VFAESVERSTYSVATSLSNICKMLDVELVVEGSDGIAGTWGAVGHYSIGSLAIELVKNSTLKSFLVANAGSISLPLDDLTKEPKNKTSSSPASLLLPMCRTLYENSAAVSGGRSSLRRRAPAHVGGPGQAGRRPPTACAKGSTIASDNSGY